MKKTEQNIHRYLDGELSPVDRKAFEARLAQDPALQAELETYRSISTQLAACPDVEPPPAERVWQDVQRGIRLASEPTAPPVWRWTWAPAALAVVLGIVFLQPFASAPVARAVIVEEVEVSASAAVPLVYTDQDSGWTVVWLSNPTLEEENAPL